MIRTALSTAYIISTTPSPTPQREIKGFGNFAEGEVNNYERLMIVGQKDSVFEAAHLEQGQNNLSVKVDGVPLNDPVLPFTNYRPVVSQIAASAPSPSVRGAAQAVMKALSSMRFLDLSPDAMRLPSLPGQTILGDRGENLSSVLQEICEKPESKQALLQWVQELTPMDAMDFEFPADFTGKILLTLIEENGQKTSAISASDGTLRFLAMIAALLGQEKAHFYFFEELDNGIHPTRLHLLLQLIERQVSQETIQIVATTHSPQLLRLLSSQSLEYASLTYRLSDRPDAQIKRIIDIPEAQRYTVVKLLTNRYQNRRVCLELKPSKGDRMRENLTEKYKSFFRISLAPTTLS